MRTRLNAISGQPVLLNTTFYQAGQPKDPYALRAVRIYKGSVRDENLVMEIPIIGGPNDCGTAESPTLASEYPSPVQRVEVTNTGACGTALDTGACGTVPGAPVYLPGAYTLTINLPVDHFCTGVYYDVWCFVGEPTDIDSSVVCNSSEATGTPPGPPDDWPPGNDFSCVPRIPERCLLSIVNKFFVVAGGWYGDDDLTTIRLGFEPLDSRFQQPEKRTLEIGMMPLPLYDFDIKKIMPLLPFLQGTITFMTQYNEPLIAAAPMSIGIRQGSYRTDPFVLRYLVDTNKFLKGTYLYRVDISLPNGETRSSPYFNITIR